MKARLNTVQTLTAQHAFFVLALFLYFCAPVSYSFSFCVVSFGLFFVNAIYLYYNDFAKEKVGFNLIFSFSFFATHYIFPLFIFQYNDSFSMFSHGYNENFICRSTALATLAYACYGLGYNHIFVRKSTGKNANYFNKREVNILLFLLLFIFFVFVLAGGLEYYKQLYNNDSFSESALHMYMNVLLIVVMTLLASSLYYYYSVKALIILLIISFIIILTGSRTLPLSIFIILFCLLSHKYNYSLKKIVIGGAAVAGLMFFIGSIRNSSREIAYENEFGALEIFTDLIVCNRNLYEEYEYVFVHGNLHGLCFLSAIMAVVPFLQSFVCTIFNLPDYYLSSSLFVTYQHFGKDMPVGLGTSIVGDAYLGGGLVGLVILFYFLGYFVKKVREGMLANDSRMSLFYNVFLANSVFICRSSIFSPLRTLVWAYLLMHFINLYFRNGERNSKTIKSVGNSRPI